MTHSAIAEQIETFIRDELLHHHGDGLSATTPLLELGILDSFGLFKLIAHVNVTFGIQLAPDQIIGRDFKDIESISRLVARQLASAAPPVPSATPEAEGIAVFEAPACAQVFVMFTGLVGARRPENLIGGARELVEDSLGFFKRAGLDGRNILLLHDTRGETYKNGISAELSTEQKVCAWLDAWIAQRPHIEDVYCIGVSAGGPMAMIAGHHLKARTVWSFGPRTAYGAPAKEAHLELLEFVRRVTRKTFRELQQGMTPNDEAKIDAAITPELVQAYYSSLGDAEKLLDVERLDAIVETLSRGNGATEHRVYYVPRDAYDARVAEAVQRCPGVTLVALDPSDAPPPLWAFSRWVPPPHWVQRDHLVLDLLRERGMFGTLFPAFRPVAVAAGSNA